MEKVKKTEGLVCLCAECDRVIGVVGEVTPDSNPRVSHGICPECANKLYGPILGGTRRKAD